MRVSINVVFFLVQTNMEGVLPFSLRQEVSAFRLFWFFPFCISLTVLGTTSEFPSSPFPSKKGNGQDVNDLY
jgi:hypothetical protein